MSWVKSSLAFVMFLVLTWVFYTGGMTVAQAGFASLVILLLSDIKAALER